MYDFEMIREKIRQIEGGVFQALAQRYYFRKHKIKSVGYSGTKAGSVKTVRSPYDALYQNNAGEWIFFEAGHISDRKNAIKKIEADIKKCLDYEKTNPEIGEVTSIVCCYSCERLTAVDLALLQKIDQRVELISADVIAEACCTDYPWLAQNYLGIDIGLSQLSDADYFIEYVEKDSFAPSLATEFVGRQEEIDGLLRLLKSYKVVCITGRSGAGKTKLGIEVGLRFSERANCDFLVVRAGHRPVYKDLVRCCSQDRNYLILLDDANDISDLLSIRDFLSLNDNVQVIATLRNYVKEHAIKELKHVKGFCEFTLPPIGEEEIKMILENQIGIANPEHLQQIIRVSRGNLRLAILAAETLKQKGVQSIINIQELLDMCYESRLSLFSTNEKTAISIASVLGAHEIENNPGLMCLEEICGIDHVSYIAACRTLHEKELLDTIHDLEAVNFEEQNLRDYFIYQSLIKNRLFTLRDLWELPDGTRRVSSVANTLLNVFYSKEVRDLLTGQIKDIWRVADSEEREQLIEVAGSLIPSESLSFLSARVQNLEAGEDHANYLDIGLKRTNHFGFKSDVLELASRFLDDADNWKHAFLIVLWVLEKNNTLTDDICHIFDNLLSPNRHSVNQGFAREAFVFRKLQELFELTQDTTYAVLLIRFAKVVLNDAIEGSEMREEGQLQLYRGVLQYNEELVELRRQWIAYLAHLREDPRFCDLTDSVIFDYVGQSDNGEVSLSKSTVDEIMAIYTVDEASLSYSLLDDIWVFRDRNAAFLEAGNWIDVLFCSQYAFQLVELCVIPLWRRYKNTEEFDERLHAAALRMTEEDWALFIDLIRRDLVDGKRKDLSIVTEVISWVIGQNANENSSINGALINAVFELDLSPGICGGNVFRYLMGVYPIQDIRSILLSRSSDNLKASWASCCDLRILEQNGDYEAFCSNVLSGLADYGEIISAQKVLDAESACPGFLGKYCEGIARSSVVDYDHKRYFVFGLTNCDEGKFETGISDPDNLLRVEELVCALLADCEDFWFGEDICGKIIHRDPDFIFRLLSVWVDANSKSYVSFDESISNLYWETKKPIDNLPRLATILDMASLGVYGKLTLAKCVSAIVKAGIEKGSRCKILEWLASEAVQNSPFSEVAIDVATSLELESRLVFCTLASELGISAEAFNEAAFSLSFSGEMWSGSEIPLINKKIDYAGKLKNALLENGHIEYLAATEEYLQFLLRRKSEEEVREFVSPFWA